MKETKNMATDAAPTYSKTGYWPTIKLLNILLIIFSLLGFMQWGHDQQSFLIELEIDLFAKLLKEPGSFLHPLVFLPLAGQVLLLITLFQQKVSKLFTLLAIVGIGLLMAIILLVGCLNLNAKMILSTVPYWIVSFLIIRHFVQQKRQMRLLTN